MSSHPDSSLLFPFPLQPNSHIPPYIFTNSFSIGEHAQLGFEGRRRRARFLEQSNQARVPYQRGEKQSVWTRDGSALHARQRPGAVTPTGERGRGLSFRVGGAVSRAWGETVVGGGEDGRRRRERAGPACDLRAKVK